MTATRIAALDEPDTQRAVQDERTAADTAIVRRLGWEQRGKRREFTATLVFPDGPPDLAPAVVWKAKRVRLIVVED